MSKIIANIFDSILPLYGTLSSYSFKTRALPPLIVQFDLTYRCNLSCQMCFQKKVEDTVNQDAENQKELDYHQICKIVDKIPSYALVTLTGGEPLIRKDFFEICDYILSKHKCNIVTNATLITQDIIDYFIRKELTLIGVSLDGVSEIHDKIRGKKGTYDKVVQFLKALQDAKRLSKSKVPLVDIKTVLLKENIETLPDVFSIADKYGATYFTISLPLGFYKYFDKNDAENIMRNIQKIKSIKSNVMLRFYPKGAFHEEVISGDIKPVDYKLCYIPWVFTRIDPYGYVIPCKYFFSEKITGTGCNPMEVWNSQKYREFRKSLRDVKLFPTCLECCYFRLDYSR